jgi:hypothetical protein
MKHIYTFLFIIATLFAFSQSDLSKQVNSLMAQLRSGQAITADRAKILSSTNYKEVAGALEKYASDTVLAVRYEALNLLSQSAERSKDKALIKRSIRATLANAVTNRTLNNQIVNVLKRSAKQDFESSELQVMKSLLNDQENNIGNLARVYAFAAGPEAQNDLKALLAKPTLNKGDKKDIKLALVRSGDESYAQKMSETLKQQVVNDELIYSALPDVLYTKNKEMFAWLLNAIMSDSKKCSSANNDDPTPIICAYRLIEQMAPQILNFPVSINDKGEIESKDLNKSLVEVRAWITKNKDSFEINRDMY